MVLKANNTFRLLNINPNEKMNKRANEKIRGIRAINTAIYLK